MSDSHGSVSSPPLSMTNPPLQTRAGTPPSTDPTIPYNISPAIIESATQSIINISVWGFALESVLYGIFLVLWVYTVAILLDRRRKVIGQRVNYFILVCAFILFGTTTTHWVTGVIQLRQIFAHAFDGEALFLYFASKQGGGINTAREVLIFISGWTLDAVLVYRVYVLFGRSIVVPVIPVLCLIGTMISGSVMTHGFLTSNFTFNESPSLREWILAAFALSLFTNLLSCALILYKTIKVHWDLRFWGGSRTLLPIVLIILESSALYTVFLLMDLIGFITNTAIVGYATVLTPAICGISFTSIVVRVARSDPKPFLPSALPPLSPGLQARQSYSSLDLPSAGLPSADPSDPHSWTRRGSVPWLEPVPLPLGGPGGMGRRASAPPAWFSDPMPVSNTGGVGWFSGIPGAGPAAGDSSATLLGHRRSSVAPLTPLAPPPPVAVRFPAALGASDARQRTRTRSTVTAVSDGEDSLKPPDSPSTLAPGEAVPMRVFSSTGT